MPVCCRTHEHTQPTAHEDTQTQHTDIADRHCEIEFNSRHSLEDPVAHVISCVSFGGTSCNRKKLSPQKYFPLRSGDVIVLQDPKHQPASTQASAPATASVTIVFESLCDPELSAFAKRYMLVGEPLGVGASAQVRKCYDRRTGEEFAAKIVQKARFTSKKALSSVENEVPILKLLNHKNIVKYYDMLQDTRTLYIILELFVPEQHVAGACEGDKS